MPARPYLCALTLRVKLHPTNSSSQGTLNQHMDIEQEWEVQRAQMIIKSSPENLILKLVQALYRERVEPLIELSGYNTAIVLANVQLCLLACSRGQQVLMCSPFLWQWCNHIDSHCAERVCTCTSKPLTCFLCNSLVDTSTAIVSYRLDRGMCRFPCLAL